MAKKNTKKPSKGRARSSGEGVKIVALLVFILIGLGIIAGSVWYYGFFQPRASEEILAVAAGFTREFFAADHDTISGKEGRSFMTDRLADRVLAGERIASWQDQELVAAIKGEVEVSLLKQGLRTARSRVIFWQVEESGAVEDEDKEKDQDKEYLVYYDLDLVYGKDGWLVDQVGIADPEELQILRQSRGIFAEEPPESD